MSKHQKKKNPPAVSSDDDETATQLLQTLGAVAPVMEPTTGADVAPVADGAAEPGQQLRPDEPWQRVETQLGTLTTVLLLVTLVTPIAAGGSPVMDRPGVDVQRAGDGASEGPPLVSTAAILGGVETAAISLFPPSLCVTAAILTTAAESGASAASSSLPHGVSPSIAKPAAKESVDRGRHLPHVREFVAAGGDWSAFRWRFEATYKSV
ncbi:unnamed protein product [Lampetra fluviatilis]